MALKSKDLKTRVIHHSLLNDWLQKNDYIVLKMLPMGVNRIFIIFRNK